MNKCGFNSFKNPCIFLIKRHCTSPVVCKYQMADDIDKDAEIARLTAENDKLQKRLENAVELKAKEGDTLFMPWKYDGNVGIATLRIIGINFRKGEFAYITDLESDNAYYLAKYKYGIFRNKDFDSIVYTDRTKAESRLEELKGGRE